MIERLSRDEADGEAWLIRPSRSLTWPEAKRFLWLLSLAPAASGLLALGFGAPLVLPFCGLEVVFLWAAFYYVARQGEQRQIVYVQADKVVIEKGRSRPIERTEFARAWVRIELHRAPHGWYPSILHLRVGRHAVALGEFLTEAERRHLAQALINAITKSS